MAWQENQHHSCSLIYIGKNENKSKMLLTDIQDKQLKGIAVKQVDRNTDECRKIQRTKKW